MYLAKGYHVQGKEKLAEDCMGIVRTWFVIISGNEIGIENLFKM
jgi:hypothetical protein